MVFISATRLRVRSIRYLLPFFMANEASLKSLSRSKGFLGGRELVDKNLVFWTLTQWETEEDMKNFRNSGTHRKAMQQLPVWCNEASYAHWHQEVREFPDWKNIHGKMLAEGRISKVRYPSPKQITGAFPAPEWTKLERVLKNRSL